MSDTNRLSGYFDTSASVVHDACATFEQHYARPAYKNMKLFFEERPIVSTFVTIFTLLSLIPIAFFAGTAVFIFLTLTLTSLLLASLAAIAIILALFAVLAVVLIGILLVSIFLTGAALSSYSLLRLALHIQREGPSTGVSEWSQETKHSFLTQKPAAEEERPTENGTTESANTTAASNKNGPIEEQRADGLEEEKPKAYNGDSNDIEEGQLKTPNSDIDNEGVKQIKEEERGEDKDENAVHDFNTLYDDHDTEVQGH